MTAPHRQSRNAPPGEPSAHTVVAEHFNSTREDSSLARELCHHVNAIHAAPQPGSAAHPSLEVRQILLPLSQGLRQRLAFRLHDVKASLDVCQAFMNISQFRFARQARGVPPPLEILQTGAGGVSGRVGDAHTTATSSCSSLCVAPPFAALSESRAY